MPITDLATNVILDNVGKVYFLKTGVYRDQVGLDNNHPLSSVSALLIHIEDGVPQNVMVANYAPSKMASWASHDFPLWYRGQVEYTITGESSPRTFAQYFTYVPSILVAMNKNGTTIMNVDVTITQNTGANLLGGFADLTALNAEFPPTEELSDDLATAYVYDSGTKGFYRVAWNSGTSEWVWQLVDQALVTYGVHTKQYNVLPIKVQRGFAPNQTPLTVSDEVIRLIYQEIAYVNAVIANHTDLLGGLRTDVDEIEDDVALLQQFDIDLLTGEKKFTSIAFDTNNDDEPVADGEMKWDGTGVSIRANDGVVLQLGRKLWAYCRNAESTTITNGTVVYMSSETIGGSPHVLIRRASNANNTAYKMIGITTEDIAKNQSGFVTIFGLLDLPTGHGFTPSDILYLGVDGVITNVMPTKPTAIVEVGICAPSDRMLVMPKVHFPISLASDVSLTANPQPGDVLMMTGGGLFRNSSLVLRAIGDSSGNNITSTYETKADAISKLALKVDKTTEIANVAIGEGISLETLKTAIGLATTSLSGLMSSTDKQYLNELYALLDTDDVDVLVNTLGELLAIFESYPEGTDIVQMFATKVDKVLSTYDTLTGENVVGTELIYIDAGGTTKKMTLNELFEASNASADALVPNGVYEDLTVGYAQKSALGVEIDTKFGTIDDEIDDIIDGTQNITFNNTISGLTATTVKGAIDEIDGNVDELETRTTVIESKLNIVGLDYKEYGVREVVGQSASDFERVTRFWGEIKLGSATGLVANVAIDDADATNSFDYIPIFKREVVDIDATDLSSNTVSNTFVKVPKFYIKEEWVTEGETEYHYIFMSQFKHEGYRLPLPFKKPDGSERDYTYMGAYEAFLDGNNKLRSLTGQIPRVAYSRNNFRIAARALDGLGVNSKYQITDLAEYVDLVQIPFMIEFATKHSQGVFAGATSMAYSASHTAIADGTAVNFIVVSNETGANFVLGQTVSISTSYSNDSIAKDRIITQIDVDTPIAGETTITFDGAAVNIAIGHVIASRAWKTGMTDNVKVSGTHALNDGKHSIVWRGLENPFGNIWKNVDGVKISNWRGYVAENPKDYNDTASVGGVYAEPYLPLGYLNANANNYVQELGYDQNYPYAKFPISVQASSGLYFRDYYYQSTGDRTVFVGGYWNDSFRAGLFIWNMNNVLDITNFYLGARLSYRP